MDFDPIRLKSQLNVIDRYFDPNNAADRCAYEEGAIGGYGWRRLMVFDAVIVNAGDGDLVVGDRSDPDNPYAGAFYLDPCHGPYRFDEGENRFANKTQTPATLPKRRQR